MSIFQSEEDGMHDAFEEVMADRLESKFGRYLFHEVKTNNRCRADYVVTKIDAERAWERVLAYGNDEPKPDDAQHAYYTAKRHCPLPSDELVDRAGYDDTEAGEKAVEWLHANGYLLKDADDWYHFHRPPFALEEITVYELKLHNWEEGIRQARKYRDMIGTEAYVVLDADRVSAAIKNLGEFKDENIGLATLTEDSMEIVHEPIPEGSDHKPNQMERLRSLGESAFWRFLDENPPPEYDRTAEDDINHKRNSYRTRETALIGDEAFEKASGSSEE